jgi:hypothetical protein
VERWFEGYHTPKIELQTTPRRAAIEYLASIHRNPEADAIQSLTRRFDEMGADIEKKVKPFLRDQEEGATKETTRLLGRATTQTCFLIELYILAVRELIHEVVSLMELNWLVSTYCNSSSSPCPSLYEQMTGQYNSLQICFETVNQIQEKYFCTWILPANYGLLVEAESNRCVSIRALVAENEAPVRAGLCQEEHCVENARAAMLHHISVIRDHTSLRQAHIAGICLKHAEDDMYSSYLKCKQYAELLAKRRGDTFQSGRFDY